jgi:hypothetical protein
VNLLPSVDLDRPCEAPAGRFERILAGVVCGVNEYCEEKRARQRALPKVVRTEGQTQPGYAREKRDRRTGQRVDYAFQSCVKRHLRLRGLQPLRYLVRTLPQAVKLHPPRLSSRIMNNPAR